VAVALAEAEEDEVEVRVEILEYVAVAELCAVVVPDAELELLLEGVAEVLDTDVAVPAAELDAIAEEVEVTVAREVADDEAVELVVEVFVAVAVLDCVDVAVIVFVLDEVGEFDGVIEFDGVLDGVGDAEPFGKGLQAKPGRILFKELLVQGTKAVIFGNAANKAADALFQQRTKPVVVTPQNTPPEVVM